MKHSALSLFCQFIRREVEGTDTLIGLLPDNVSVPSFPGALPSLGIYTRFRFDPDDEPTKVVVKLVGANGITLAEQEIPSELVHKACAEAKANKLPLAGIINRISATPFPVSNAGLLRVEATIGNETILCGILNIKSA